MSDLLQKLEAINIRFIEVGKQIVDPDIIADMKNGKRDDTLLSHLMMTLCWLKLYKTEHVMSGRWGFGEEFCRDTVKHVATRLQRLKAKKIKFGPFDLERIYLGTVDCVHFETNEFRTDPNSKWYSHKHNGAGARTKSSLIFAEIEFSGQPVLNLPTCTILHFFGEALR